MLLLLSLQSMLVFFSTPPNTSVDQNPDPMSDVGENLHVVPPPIIAPLRRSVRER